MPAPKARQRGDASAHNTARGRGGMAPPDARGREALSACSGLHHGGPKDVAAAGEVGGVSLLPVPALVPAGQCGQHTGRSARHRAGRWQRLRQRTRPVTPTRLWALLLLPAARAPRPHTAHTHLNTSSSPGLRGAGCAWAPALAVTKLVCCGSAKSNLQHGRKRVGGWSGWQRAGQSASPRPGCSTPRTSAGGWGLHAPPLCVRRAACAPAAASQHWPAG